MSLREFVFLSKRFIKALWTSVLSVFLSSCGGGSSLSEPRELTLLSTSVPSSDTKEDIVSLSYAINGFPYPINVDQDSSHSPPNIGCNWSQRTGQFYIDIRSMNIKNETIVQCPFEVKQTVDQSKYTGISSTDSYGVSDTLGSTSVQLNKINNKLQQVGFVANSKDWTNVFIRGGGHLMQIVYNFESPTSPYINNEFYVIKLNVKNPYREITGNKIKAASLVNMINVGVTFKSNKDPNFRMEYIIQLYDSRESFDGKESMMNDTFNNFFSTPAIYGQKYISLINGSAAVPSLNFGSEPTTGLYRPGSGELGISILGSNIATVDSGEIGRAHV